MQLFEPSGLEAQLGWVERELLSKKTVAAAQHTPHHCPTGTGDGPHLGVCVNE